MNIKSVFFLCITILTSNLINAQDTILVSDFETWASVELEKKLLNKKLELNLSEEFRFNNNSTEIKEFFTEIGLGYELYKNLKVGIGYRYTKQNKDEVAFVTKHRFFADFKYSFDVKRWDFNSRIRFQTGNDTWFDNSVSDYSTNKFRLKLTGTYNIKNWKLDPYFSPELFYVSEKGNIPYLSDEYSDLIRQNGFEKLRLTTGTSFKFKDAGSMKFFFSYERQFGQFANDYQIPGQYYILGLSYKFSF